jgi:RNA polymerase sigma-70 factor (ECF subfamily)
MSDAAHNAVAAETAGGQPVAVGSASAGDPRAASLTGDAALQPDTEDLSLAVRFGIGDDSAYEEIVIKYQLSMLELATRLLNQNWTAAEEVVQDVFVEVYRNVRDRGKLLDSAQGIRALLFFVLYRRCSDARRRLKSCGSFVSLDSDPAVAAYLEAEVVTSANEGTPGCTPDAAQLFDDSLAHLPEVLRVAYSLVHQQNKTIRDAAAALGLAPTTVQSRVKRAEELLHLDLRRKLSREIT